MDKETSKNTDNKEKKEEKEEKSKGSSNLATGILVRDIVKENLAATTAKFRAAWEAIKKYPNTCKYFEPTQSQLRLIVGSKYSIKDAFEIAGDHNHPCRSCMANEGREDCFFFNHIARLTADANKQKDEHPTMAQKSLRKYMYDIFVKKEYSYLRSLTGKVKLDRLPLPLCFETSVKQAFPNPEGLPYTGFQRTRVSKKNNFR